MLERSASRSLTASDEHLPSAAQVIKHFASYGRDDPRFQGQTLRRAVSGWTWAGLEGVLELSASSLQQTRNSHQRGTSRGNQVFSRPKHWR
jgi:hypothetical protein